MFEEEGPMEFHVFQCQSDRDYFVVTDEEHVDAVLKGKNVCPTPGDRPEKVGVFEEVGKDRVAFDEGLARRSIQSQGYYRFEAKTFDPVAQRPLVMP
jgi:hypothetical protein